VYAPLFHCFALALNPNLILEIGSNDFKKKADNLKVAVALYFAHWNFVRRHGTL
jgi:hypothetical protein